MFSNHLMCSFGTMALMMLCCLLQRVYDDPTDKAESGKFRILIRPPAKINLCETEVDDKHYKTTTKLCFEHNESLKVAAAMTSVVQFLCLHASQRQINQEQTLLCLIIIFTGVEVRVSLVAILTVPHNNDL